MKKQGTVLSEFVLSEYRVKRGLPVFHFIHFGNLVIHFVWWMGKSEENYFFFIISFIKAPCMSPKFTSITSYQFEGQWVPRITFKWGLCEIHNNEWHYRGKADTFPLQYSFVTSSIGLNYTLNYFFEKHSHHTKFHPDRWRIIFIIFLPSSLRSMRGTLPPARF